jgi:hypothetical protein
VLNAVEALTSVEGYWWLSEAEAKPKPSRIILRNFFHSGAFRLYLINFAPYKKPKIIPAMSVSTMLVPPLEALEKLGIKPQQKVHYQESPDELTQHALDRGEGVLNDTGALVIRTGEFTGRSPKDKFIVKDAITAETVNWNEFNLPIDEDHFNHVYDKLVKHLSSKEIWVRDCYA